MSNNVLVIGGINVDYVVHADRPPKLGESLVGKDFAMNCGGKGAKQSVAIAKLGCDVKILGAVGQDIAADMSLKNLKKFGVDCSSVIRVDAPTGAALITVCGGDNQIVVDVGANDKLTPEHIKEQADLFDWADILVMQLEVPTKTVLEAAKMAASRGKTVILNPAPIRQIDKDIYGYVDWIIPNEIEAQLITGICQNNRTDTEIAMAEFRKMGCKNALITLGGRGCAYHDGEKVCYEGVFDVKRVDTTAAGDSFIGGLCSALCDGKSIDQAVYYASAVSSITVGREGASISIPTADEVVDFLKENTIKTKC